MRKLTIYITITLTALLSEVALGQHQAMYSQYMFNGLVLNPAYAGYHDAISVTALSRRQWAGIEGTPTTNTLTVHSPLSNGKVGLGMALINDQIGVTSTNGAHVMYAFRLKSERYENSYTNFGMKTRYLSFGLQAGVVSIKEKLTELGIDNDPNFAEDINSTQFNFGAGLFYSTERFYMGLSAPQLFQQKTVNSNSDRFTKNYFFTTGYLVSLNPYVNFKPSTLIKYIDGSAMEVDVNANIYFKETVELGVGYRTSGAVTAMASFNINDKLRFGYAYDLQGVNDQLAGSHEFMINYKFSVNKKKICFIYF